MGGRGSNEKGRHEVAASANSDVRIYMRLA